MKIKVIFIIFLCVLFVPIRSFANDCPDILGWSQVRVIPYTIQEKNFTIIHISQVIEKPVRLKFIPIVSFFLINTENKDDVLVLYLSGIMENNKFILHESYLYEARWFGENNKQYFSGNMCLLSNYDFIIKGKDIK